MPKELDKLVEIASMQRGPFTRQHAPDPTIKSVTKTKLQNLRSWSDQNRLVWHNFFAIYLHFLLNRAMGFLSETNVLARDALGQLLPAAKDLKKPSFAATRRTRSKQERNATCQGPVTTWATS